MNDGFRDLRRAARQALRFPLHSAAVIGSLAIGIATVVATFGLVETVFWRPLPYGDASRLVALEFRHPELGANRVAAPGLFARFDRETTGLSGLVAFLPRDFDLQIDPLGSPQPLEGALVSSNLLAVLRVSAALGRAFQPGDGGRADERPALLSHRTWVRLFGADPGVVGRLVRAREAGRPTWVRVVGVFPESFRAPFAHFDPELVVADSQGAGGPLETEWVYLFGRLAPEFSPQAAEAELQTVHRRHQAELGPSDWRLALVPLREAVAGSARQPLAFVFWAGALIFLIAATNAAQLLAARLLARSGELAVRVALGGDRNALARLHAFEAGVLAVTAGALGLGLAAAVLAWLSRADLLGLPRRFVPSVLGPWTLGFTGSVLAATIVLFTLVPLWRGLRVDPARHFAATGSAVTSGSLRRVRWLSVAFQLALAVPVSTAAFELWRGLVSLQTIDPGFAVAATTALRLALPEDAYPSAEARTAFYRQLLERLEQHPEVVAAGLTHLVPLGAGSATAPVRAEGEAAVGEAPGVAFELRFVSPGFFSALDIPTRVGRVFRDGELGRPVAVLSERAATLLWGSRSPLLRRLVLGSPEEESGPFEVIGVVGDVRSESLATEAPPTVYLPLLGGPPMTLVVRSRRDSARDLGPTLAGVLREIDPALPVFEHRTFSDAVREALRPARSAAFLVGAFGFAAAFLAVCGGVGLARHLAAERRREFAIRGALGATPGVLIRGALEEAAPWLAAGALLGAVGSLGVGRVLGSLLQGISPAALGSTALAALSLLGSVLLGWLQPIWRAAKREPRSELSR